MQTAYKNRISSYLLALLIISPFIIHAQTDMDAIMMNKKQFCQGLTYMHSSWDHYWEGTFNRTNANMGTVTTQSVMYMPNYGITNNLNIMASVPYVWTNASAGTLHGMKGVQDLIVFLKWRPLVQTFGKNKVSFYLIGGVSTPLTNYVIDFLPMSIGLGSTNLIGRGMVDFRHSNFTVTGSATYVRRSNVKLDRDSYYDTQLHLTNEVKMPDFAEFQLRTGYRGKYLIVEALATQMTTFGGFDITKNNMPFPSNRMNATMVGLSAKYTLKCLTNLAIVADGNYTVAGRNMGQALEYNAGIFYAFYFKSHNNLKKN